MGVGAEPPETVGVTQGPVAPAVIELQEWPVPVESPQAANPPEPPVPSVPPLPVAPAFPLEPAAAPPLPFVPPVPPPPDELPHPLVAITNPHNTNITELRIPSSWADLWSHPPVA